MIKTIITAVVTAIAGLIGYLVSDGFRERMAQRVFCAGLLVDSVHARNSARGVENGR